jgi:hypothetical protein
MTEAEPPPMASSDRPGLATIMAPALVLMAAATIVFGEAGALGQISPYLAILGAFGAFGLLAGMLGSRMPPLVSRLMLAVVTIFSFDLAFSLWVRLYNLIGDWLTDNRLIEQGLAWLLLLLPGAAVLMLGRRAALTIAVSSTVFALGVLAMPPTGDRVPPLLPAGQPAGPLGRVVVHLMLDEHIGPNGIPLDIPGGADARRQMTDFYLGQGFRLYPNAISDYSVTEKSLPALLWLDDPISHTDPMTELPFQGGNATSALFPRWHEQTPWFAQLNRDGYRVMVYSIGGLFNLCTKANRPVVDICRIYRSDALNLDLWPGHRLRRIFAMMASRSLIVQKVCRGIGACPALMMEYNVSSATAMDRVAEALQGASGDVAIFAHILLPHGPQALDAECRPEPTPDLIASDEVQLFSRYFEQIACTRLKVAAILDVLKERKALDRAVIIIHGDHGLRPEMVSPDEERWAPITRSTLFAVRAPGVGPELNVSAKSVQELLPMAAHNLVKH